LTDESFEAWASSDHDPVQIRILSVIQMGDAACVALAWGTPYFDFHTMVRVNGRWNTTNQTATHKSR